MHGQGDLPLIRGDAPMTEALLVMTEEPLRRGRRPARPAAPCSA